MANEITITTALRYENGDLGGLTVPSRTQKIDQNTAAPSRVGGCQTIGTTEEAIALTDLTTNGVARFRNRDATNFVEIGVKPAATFYPLVRLNADEECIFRLSQGITPYAKADTAACILDRDILDD